ncbi:pyocin knob domain-containing protein [Serratia fonticola]
MSSEGLPVNNVVGTSVELAPRSTADAASAASSSQAADSAAASADRAWKFSNDSAKSATAAKTSENNAAAAMANALSKVDTAEQSVASTVLFSKPTRLASGIAANFIPKTEGIWASWSRAAGRGSADFVNHRGNGSGGYWFYDTDGATIKALAYLNGAGDLTTIGSLTSSNMYIGTTAVLKTGDYGIGGGSVSMGSTLSIDDNTLPSGNYYANASTTGSRPEGTYGHLTMVREGSIGASARQIWNANTSADLWVRIFVGTTWSAWRKLWNSLNTTVDANGFIKKASPIVKLFGTGEGELNDESEGVTTERISVGVYRVSGVLGFNGDGAWGGAGNGIEIPVDDNKRPLIWVESKVLPDGDIEIRTYHRTYGTGPYSARNIEAMDSGEVDKKKQPIFVEMPDGTPIDIPAGRWIDLRVEMPASDEPEYEPVPEDKDAPEVTPEVTEPWGGEEQASGETPSPIEEAKE